MKAKVEAGELPPIRERLPGRPNIVSFDGSDRELGAYGGDMRILTAKQKDIRMMMVYGYARLVGYNPKLDIVPDILESVTVEEDRIFTFYLREGHRWSDGHPFTSEDFRYYWDDIINDDDLSPFGPPRILQVDGEAPKVEIVNAYTVRYSWSNPNPFQA